MRIRTSANKCGPPSSIQTFTSILLLCDATPRPLGTSILLQQPIDFVWQVLSASLIFASNPMEDVAVSAAPSPLLLTAADLQRQLHDIPVATWINSACDSGWCARCALRCVFTTQKYFAAPYADLEASVAASVGVRFHATPCPCCLGLLHATAHASILKPPTAGGSTGVLSQYPADNAVASTLSGRHFDTAELSGALRLGKATSLINAMLSHPAANYYQLTRDWVEDVVSMIAHSGFDMRDGIAVGIHLTAASLAADTTARAALCTKLGVPVDKVKVVDLKDCLRMMCEAAVGRILYEPLQGGSGGDATAPRSVHDEPVILTAAQGELVLEQALGKRLNATAEASAAAAASGSAIALDMTGRDPNDPRPALAAADEASKNWVLPYTMGSLPAEVPISAVLTDPTAPAPPAIRTDRVHVDLAASDASPAAEYGRLSVVAGGLMPVEAEYHATAKASGTSTAAPLAPGRKLRSLMVAPSSSLLLMLHTDIVLPQLAAQLRARAAAAAAAESSASAASSTAASAAAPAAAASVGTSVVTPSLLTVTLTRNSLLVSGSYCKFHRGVAQTPWFLEGTRKGVGTSVEELLGTPIAEVVQAYCGVGAPVAIAPPSGHGGAPVALPPPPKLLPRFKFHSAGREDIDVRMLGDGRPFMIELLDSRPAILPLRAFLEMEAAIQACAAKWGSPVDGRRLRPATKQEFGELQTGAEDKRKNYTALVWSSYPHTAEQLATALHSVSDLQLDQRTPIRVCHRRTLLSRAKIIHSLRTSWLSEHFFILDLVTSAGTYVKEFVHGDLGRTTPSLCDLLTTAAAARGEGGAAAAAVAATGGAGAGAGAAASSSSSSSSAASPLVIHTDILQLDVTGLVYLH